MSRPLHIVVQEKLPSKHFGQWWDTTKLNKQKSLILNK